MFLTASLISGLTKVWLGTQNNGAKEVSFNDHTHAGIPEIISGSTSSNSTFHTCKGLSIMYLNMYSPSKYATCSIQVNDTIIAQANSATLTFIVIAMSINSTSNMCCIAPVTTGTSSTGLYEYQLSGTTFTFSPYGSGAYVTYYIIYFPCWT